MEVHDCFSITELVPMEDLGLSQPADAVHDILDGRYDRDGAVPCQTDGGLKCFGHPIGASGLRMAYEIYTQLLGTRRRAPAASPSLGLTHNLGGIPNRNVASVSVLGLHGDDHEQRSEALEPTASPRLGLHGRGARDPSDRLPSGPAARARSSSSPAAARAWAARMAYLFARLGADVMICGRRQEKLDETAAGIKQHVGREIATHAMTIRDPEQVDALMARRMSASAGSTRSSTTAAASSRRPPIDFSVKGWNAVIDTNLNGTWYMMQAAARAVARPRQPGSIVNIVATIWRGMPQVAHTCAARAGVIYLARRVAIEWAPLNIRVNCVAPGAIATEGLNVYPDGAARSSPTPTR